MLNRYINQEKNARDHITNNKKPTTISKQCDICGATLAINNFKRHGQTKKHSDSTYTQFLKFEIKWYI